MMAAPRAPRRRWRALRLVLGLLVVAAAGGWATIEAAVRWLPCPPIPPLPPPAAVVLDRHGGLLLLHDHGGTCWLPLPAGPLNPRLAAALLAVEDHRFRHHAGVDLRALLSAGWDDLWHRHHRGASTITMQLASLRWGRPRSLAGKVVQAIRAWQIERGTDKDAILREYCARVVAIPGCIGFEAASWRWWGRSSRDLAWDQAALLAGLVQGPGVLRPDRHPDRARRRRSVVLDALVQTGAITPAQASRLARREVGAGARPSADPALQTALLALPVTADGVARTTIDPLTAAAAAAAARSARLAAGAAYAAVVVADRHGAVRALASIGGPRWCDLTDVQRSTGSVLKPFIYAQAFADGVATPRTRLWDGPRAWAGYAPRDADHAWEGTIAAAEALARSRNLPAIALLERIGVSRLARLLADAGAPACARHVTAAGLSAAVGGVPASPRAIAAAYLTLLRAGCPRALHLIAAPAPATEERAVLPARACAATLTALALPERTAAVLGAADAGIAWKTGTSSGHRDAWCAAVTHDVVVVVWVGAAQGHGTTAVVGVDAAAPAALALTHAVDPVTAPWEPAGDDAEGDAAAPAERLAWVVPADGSELAADPDAPVPACPGVSLGLVAAGGVAGPRWWLDNGRLLKVAPAEAPVPVQLGPGTHRLVVIDGAGASAVATVLVRGVAETP